MNLSNETPQDAARRLAHVPIAQGFKPEALHEYTDEKGNTLYWRIRLKHPESGEKWIRPMRLEHGGGYVLGEPEYPNGKPLYNLRRLSAATHPIIVCEGEWCVDKLTELGIFSTTSGAAESATKADWQPLARGSVIIWPDNDEAGQRFATSVTAELKKLDCQLKQIDVKALHLPTKGDVVDWLSLNPNRTEQDIFNLPTIDVLSEGMEASPQKQGAEDNDIEENKTRQNQASLLVDFVTARTQLFHDENLEVYARDLMTLETRRLDSRQFKDWLVANFYESTGKSPRDQSLREALSTLGGLARYKGECHPVYLRVAHYNGAYFLDLAQRGQSDAICITPGKWEIIAEPPVRFLRPETLKQLPKPMLVGGDLSTLWQIVNIPENDRILVLTWLMECLRPDTPFPILELIGEQGSAKSTTQTMLRQLIDPNACDLRGAPKTVEDIFVSAGVNWLVSYENISHLSSAIQDSLCVIATGGGYAKRKLYSDADETVINVKRPIVLNGISAAITAQDLIDRTISIETPRITTKRSDITKLWAVYTIEHPKFLGALLDSFSQALAHLSDIQLPSGEQPRLSEFVRLGMAVAKVLGKPAETFLKQFNGSRQESIARTLDASPVASALMEWFFEIREKRTTVLPLKSLFEEVAKKRPDNTEAWPRSPKGFADALRRVAPALRQMDIECRSLGKTGSYISWEIKAVSEVI